MRVTLAGIQIIWPEQEDYRRSLKGSIIEFQGSWRILHQTKRQEKAFLLDERNWRVERGESSHYIAPPSVSATQQCWSHCCVNSFCSHGKGEPEVSPTSSWLRTVKPFHCVYFILVIRQLSAAKDCLFFCWTFNGTKLCMKGKPKAFIELLANLIEEEIITKSKGSSLSNKVTVGECYIPNYRCEKSYEHISDNYIE